MVAIDLSSVGGAWNNPDAQLLVRGALPAHQQVFLNLEAMKCLDVCRVFPGECQEINRVDQRRSYRQ